MGTSLQKYDFNDSKDGSYLKKSMKQKKISKEYSIWILRIIVMLYHI